MTSLVSFVYIMSVTFSSLVRFYVSTVTALHSTFVYIRLIYQVNQKNPPTTFVDITAMHGNFCTKFYMIVKRSNIHFITKFY